MVADMRNRVTLPEAIKAIRVAKSQIDPHFKGGPFATALAISDGQFYNIEAGRRRPNDDLLARIADQLGVSVNAISYLPEATR